MSDIDQFLESQQTRKPEDSGTFRLAEESMLKKYESLLPDYRSGVLFFFQAAERWGATLIDVKVRRMRIEIEIHLPPESTSVLMDLRDSPDLVERFLPVSHPLYELGHGYKILSRGNGNTRQTIEINQEKNCLLITHHDDNASRLRISKLFRIFFHWELIGQIWCQSKLRIDSSPHRQYKCHRSIRLFLGFREQRGDEESFPWVFAHFLSPGRRSSFLKPWKKETELPVTRSEFPVFQFEHPEEGYELLFLMRKFSLKSDSCFVPVRYGVALQPIEVDDSIGYCLLTFQADHLETDLSGLKLVKNEAYFRTIENCRSAALQALSRLYRVQGEFQPSISRAELLEKAGLWTLAAPVLAGLFLGAPGFAYGAKSILPKLFYGATAAGGFHSYARHIPNPETYTAAMRKKRLEWLDDERLLETMAKYGVEVEPPGL